MNPLHIMATAQSVAPINPKIRRCRTNGLWCMPVIRSSGCRVTKDSTPHPAMKAIDHPCDMPVKTAHVAATGGASASRRAALKAIMAIQP